MFKNLLYFYFTALFLLVLPANDSLAKSKQKQAYNRGLIVYAPPSLSNILHKSLKDYSKQQNIAMSASFDSSFYLAEKIEDGAPANIIITDDPKIMKDLKQKGLINVYSLTNIISDSMLVVAPKEHYLIKKLKKYETTKDKLRFLSKNALTFVPDVNKEILGKHFKEYVKTLGFWQYFKKSIITAENSREGLFLASKGNNPTLIYKSDLKYYKNFEVLVKIPKKAHKKIVYQAAIVADLFTDKKLEDSQKFIEFLKSESVKAQLLENGFLAI